MGNWYFSTSAYSTVCVLLYISNVQSITLNCLALHLKTNFHVLLIWKLLGIHVVEAKAPQFVARVFVDFIFHIPDGIKIANIGTSRWDSQPTTEIRCLCFYSIALRGSNKLHPKRFIFGECTYERIATEQTTLPRGICYDKLE